MVKVISCKKWCEENITPMAWSRVVLKLVPELRDKGHTIKDIENPEDDLTVDEDTFKLFNGVLKNLYEMEMPQTVGV